MRYISASIVVPVKGNLIERGVVAVDETGMIVGVYEEKDPAVSNVKKEFYEGVLIPGFINAHCHIELSHMLGKTPRETGLPRFLINVMKQRASNEEEILAQMEAADKAMYESGIQAVGDHVNTTLSATVKSKSPMTYHTFVEVMAMTKDDIQSRVDRARDIEFYFDANHASITPHAPYSCLKDLFKAFRKLVHEDNILSIHNQESDEENRLYRYREGEFLEFYKEMNLNYESFRAQARNSLQSYLSHLPHNNTLILVHNTYTSLKDIDFTRRLDRDVYYCMCPKANLYIEGKLPKILQFVPDNDRMLVGTDSLASNDTLNILEELKVIVEQVPELDFLQLIKWTTINGAEALGLSSTMGSIEVGKRPGLVLIEGMHNLHLTAQATSRRIV